jgi:hypothetical protein
MEIPLRNNRIVCQSGIGSDLDNLPFLSNEKSPILSPSLSKYIILQNVVEVK